MNEFEFIKGLNFSDHKDYKQGYPNGCDLKDDIALLAPHPEGVLIVSKDIIAEDTHFFADDPLDKIIQKAIRVNISDIAAKGAKPYGFMVGLLLPEWIRSAENLKIIQDTLNNESQYFNMPLIGGDTVHAKNFAISVTIFGICSGPPPLRSGARIGDNIYVTGTLGESASGLYIKQHHIASNNADKFRQKYLLPEPPFRLGQALYSYMSAACDISDGLINDLEHILKASQCGAYIDIDTIPHANAFANDDLNLRLALTGGDDYQILFTSSAHEKEINMLSQSHTIPITKIGHITQGNKITYSREIDIQATLKNF
ncbi:MAG: thiamine-phosphate kinase [Pseudomonadota bacterium]